MTKEENKLKNFFAYPSAFCGVIELFIFVRLAAGKEGTKRRRQKASISHVPGRKKRLWLQIGSSFMGQLFSNALTVRNLSGDRSSAYPKLLGTQSKMEPRRPMPKMRSLSPYEPPTVR